MKIYGTPAEALEDAMRLSAAMTRKLAVAGLPFGGGKAVLAVPEIPRGESRRALFLRYGDLVASLGGTYRTSSDINTNEADMDVVGERTEFVFGRSQGAGGSGNPATPTAVGVFHGIRSGLAYQLGSSDLQDGPSSCKAPVALVLHSPAGWLTPARRSWSQTLISSARARWPVASAERQFRLTRHFRSSATCLRRVRSAVF